MAKKLGYSHLILQAEPYSMVSWFPGVRNQIINSKVGQRKWEKKTGNEGEHARVLLLFF